MKLRSLYQLIDNIEISDINSTSNEIDSGTVLGLPDQKSEMSWIYIPINKTFEVDRLEFKAKREKIQKIYKKIFSDLNETSLVIYSGPPDEERDRPLRYRYRSYFPFNCSPYHYHPRRRIPVGLLVTGDFPFSKVNYIEKRLQNFLPLVGLTQIPHHGSGRNSGNPITNNALFAFVQYGTRNSYKHPNYGVIDIYESYGIRVLEVTEYEYTKFNEIIERR